MVSCSSGSLTVRCNPYAGHKETPARKDWGYPLADGVEPALDGCSITARSAELMKSLSLWVLALDFFDVLSKFWVDTEPLATVF